MGESVAIHSLRQISIKIKYNVSPEWIAASPLAAYTARAPRNDALNLKVFVNDQTNLTINFIKQIPQIIKLNLVNYKKGRLIFMTKANLPLIVV